MKPDFCLNPDIERSLEIIFSAPSDRMHTPSLVGVLAKLLKVGERSSVDLSRYDGIRARLKLELSDSNNRLLVLYYDARPTLFSETLALARQWIRARDMAPMQRDKQIQFASHFITEHVSHGYPTVKPKEFKALWEEAAGQPETVIHQKYDALRREHKREREEALSHAQRLLVEWGV